MRPFLVSMLVASAALGQQQDFSKVEVKAAKVAGNVYMLTGSGGNIGATVGDDGIAIIDDQFAPLAPKIHAALRQLSPAPVRFVINTHWHGDHTGGNVILGQIPADAKVIPGHGLVSDVPGLRKYRGMLDEVVTTVKKARAAGKTVEQMQKEKILAPWNDWGKGFIKADAFIATVAEDLAKN